MSEQESFNIYIPSIHLDIISASLPYLLYEAQVEGAKRQTKAEEFVRRYPMPPKRKRGKR